MTATVDKVRVLDCVSLIDDPGVNQLDNFDVLWRSRRQHDRRVVKCLHHFRKWCLFLPSL